MEPLPGPAGSHKILRGSPSGGLITTRLTLTAEKGMSNELHRMLAVTGEASEQASTGEKLRGQSIASLGMLIAKSIP
jgi:hypothetical protein